jgi:hypothetical protein
MKNQITTRDIEQLSAYLDNQLSGKERALLESRLKTNPQLRNELQAINQTRLMLRQLPRHKAPHNYYIKAEAVQRRPHLNLAPVFGMVSAVATVLLVVVLLSSRMVTPTSQVALAPAASVPSESISVQEETGRAQASPIPPTEAPPAVAMSAPASAATSTPFAPPTEAGETAVPTPTTIYLYAYPPTATIVGGLSMNQIPTQSPTLSCDNYSGTEPKPGSGVPDYCVTPTETIAESVESSLQENTPTMTPTATLTTTPTGSATPTATPTPTCTPTLTETPSPTQSPPPTSTEMPPAAQKSAPTGSSDNTAGNTAPSQQLGAGNPASTAPTPTQPPEASTSFFENILLTIEISLAAIAVLTGVTAIILRLRAR